ncbi:hypothetical protein XBP1_400049 [Xenorhabdus bovienii str. puntauvense]|uniref:Uncharacterized protein n=1 Tax=Xenorhabdus bovienii str. puntauvense TaxID=1398201 RepID=A0A077NL83_XENBV|nr:hypothetical protein XBP1_400049 [Xenorhabdus bovienii str. puntauvense]
MVPIVTGGIIDEQRYYADRWIIQQWTFFAQFLSTLILSTVALYAITV